MYAIFGIYLMVLVGLAGLCQPSCGQISLNGSSFAIRSTILRGNAGQRQDWVEVEERYSQEQRRARIDYRFRLSESDPNRDPRFIGSTKSRGSFVFDSERQVAVLMDQKCTKSNSSQIHATLGLYMPKDVDGIADHIVGSARLLFFLEKHRNKMALVAIKEPIMVRNMRSLMYKYEHQDESTGKLVKFAIFYSELSRAADKEKSLPIQVVIDAPDDALIIVDFWEPELIAANAPRHLRRFESFNEHSSHDLFSYRLASGCSEALAEQAENLLSSTDDSNKSFRQFSFLARIKSYSMASSPDPSGELFVAYDSSLNSVRIDSVNTGSTSLFSLDLNRAYHVLGERPQHRRRTTLIGQPDGSFESVPQTECIVSRVHEFFDTMRNDAKRRRFSMNKILLGSDKFVYMGKGQVHGIDALIYEASDASLPFWLDRGVPYFQSAHYLVMRDPLQGLSDVLERKTVDLVAYFAEQDDEHRLLMIDINQFNADKTRMYGKVTIYIDGFVWKIDNQSPTGQRASEMFSLADECSVGEGRDRYGQVNLLLESAEQLNEAASLLDVVSLRDMALLASLQDRYNIPASMIYDLETRVRRHRDHMSVENADITQLHVSFRVARHTKIMSALTFKGFGTKKSVSASGDDVLRVQSFEDCFIEAASRAGEGVVGFRHADNICLLDTAALKVLRQATAGGKTNNATSKVLESSSDTVELYMIGRDRDLVNMVQPETESPHQLMRVFQKLDLAGVDRKREKVTFTVKAVHFDVVGRQSPLLADGKANEDELESRLEDARKSGLIRGLAIVKDRTSKRIGSVDDKTYSMSEDKCRTACLADSDCKLYSICLINLETSCITSALNVTNYLRDIIASGMKEDQAGRRVVKKIELQLPDDQQLELSKHPNCKTKLKNYLDLFSKPSYRQLIGRRRLYVVDDVGKCAEMVAMRDVKVLKEEAKRLPDALSLLSATDSSRQALNLDSIHRKTMKTLLHGFYYFDKEVFNQISFQDVRDFDASQLKQLSEIIDPDSNEGFCLFEGEPPEGEEEEEEEEEGLDFKRSIILEQTKVHIFCNLYRFKFETFYEKHHGVRLTGSILSAAEYEVMEKFSRGQGEELTESDSAMMRSLLDRGDNIQLAVPANLQGCAEICFSQSKGPWPGCRSFDFVTYNHPSRESSNSVHKTPASVCFLNSITLKQAFANQRYDLVYDRADDSLFIHNEPQAGFFEREAELGYHVRLLASLAHTTNSIRIQGFGIFCIVILSLFGGIVLGAGVATKYLAAKELDRQQHEESLVSPRADRVIEFNNQVTEEGKVRLC